MVDSESAPKIGQLVRIKRGRDAGKLSVIIKVESERFIWIADGDKRKFDLPKRKNLLHVELLEIVADEVVQSIEETGRVTNGKLRFVVNKYKEIFETETLIEEQNVKGE